MLVISVSCLMLAVLAKEKTIMLVLLIPLAFLAFAKPPSVNRAKLAGGSLILFAVIGVGYSTLYRAYGNPRLPAWNIPHQIPIAGKTGTAEVQGHNDTSWFASFSTQYVVVISIPDTGQGANYAAPVARKVYEGLYGVGRPALLPAPPAALPKVVAP